MGPRRMLFFSQGSFSPASYFKSQVLVGASTSLVPL